jgi:pilus assembly protein Flp/PilA
MRVFFDAILSFLREDDGPTAVEYAVLLAFIVAVCVGSVGLLSNAVSNSLNSSGTAITSAFNN